MTDTPHGAAVPDTVVSDTAAQRLIARAIELDARRSDVVSVAQLRDAVLEAGVSPAAFDAALAELRATLHLAAPPTPAPPPGRAVGWWARMRDRVRGDAASAATVPTSMIERLVASAVALAAFWGMLTLLDSAADAAAVSWAAQKLCNVVATALGALLAHRLRARAVRWVLAALAVAQGAELAMDLAFGAPSVIGAGGHWAVILASALGVGVGALLGRERDAAPAQTPPAPAVVAEPHAAERTPTPAAPRRLLRLRHASIPRPATS